MTIVDIWCNVFTERGIDSLFRAPAEVAEVVGWWGMEDRLTGRPVDQFVKHMDENEVDAVLVPSARMASYSTRQLIWNVPDEDVQELVDAAPGRVHGLVGIDPFEGMAGVRRLEHWVKRGFVGAHLHPYGFGLPVNDRKFYPFYAKCAELGVPVVMQVGHSAERMPSAMGRPILIDDIALDFPELSIVGTHTGWPWVEELVALAWKHPNVYIGTSAHHPRYWDPALISFAATRGRGKVLFGTDWPVVDYPDARTAIDAMTMKDEARRLLLGDAAKKLFRLS